MSVKHLQRQFTEAGRIRLGRKGLSSRGKEIPIRLETFRLTSPRLDLIERAAAEFGGEVEPWEPPQANRQWQVITQATSLKVLIPQQDVARGQFYELWKKSGCQRRCDGETELISRKLCLCDPEARECSLHTRVNVMLEDLPGIGVWRIDTGSYYAALELPGVAQLLAQAKGLIPGRLILDQRTRVRDGQTKHFAIPVLDVAEFTPGELISGKAGELAAARRAAAIEGRTAAAIASGPDYSSLILTATTIEALQELWEEAGTAGVMTEALRTEFGEQAAAIRARTQAQSEEPVDAEIVDDATELGARP